MKNCPYCKIDVGGNLKKCPFCQSTLSGIAETDYFPKPTTLRIKSFFYRLQQFIIFAIIIAALGAEWLLHVKLLDDVKWSLLLTLWLMAFEFGIMNLFKRGFHASRILTFFVLTVTTLLAISAYEIQHGTWEIMVTYAFPIIIMGMLIANFVLAMIDQISNAMVYLLTNVVIGITPYIVINIMKHEVPLTWSICLLVSIILFVGAVIFKGRAVFSELQKRLNV